MTSVTFRRAAITDLPAIISLLADDALGQQREDASLPLDRRYQEAFQVIDADRNQLQGVAVMGETVVGTLHLTFIPGLARKGAWRGQIEGVRIAASHRDSGLGKRMIEWAVAQCRARDCQIVQLTTDKKRLAAHRFYERLGFVPSHLGYKLML
jgi:GNAT superfamily N-acetyltransferase